MAVENNVFKIYGLIDAHAHPILVAEVTLPTERLHSGKILIPLVKLFDAEGSNGKDEFNPNNEYHRLAVENLEVYPILAKAGNVTLTYLWSVDVELNRGIAEGEYKISLTK